jgi:hypothetical protein
VLRLRSSRDVFVEGDCFWLEFVVIFGQRCIFVCAGAKTVVLFEDGLGCNRFRWQFAGHTEELVMETVVDKHCLASVGAGRELFLWTSAAPALII